MSRGIVPKSATRHGTAHPDYLYHDAKHDAVVPGIRGGAGEMRKVILNQL